MQIGKVLQQQRIQHHWSQAELADKLNISRQSISKWEQDVSLPSFANVVAISDLFKISLDDLIRGDDELMSKLMTNKKMSPVAKMIWWAFGIAIMMYVILMVAGVGEKSLNEWIQLPLIVSFAGLVFTVNWRQLNRSLSKPAIILGIILLTSLIVPNIYSFVQGFIQGMAE
ncbi:helix-turn-helix domain-containing protein [Lentilactobacillus parabuchneri]|uniref:helix-turn-helix domain-containing protein n=1 Tax=Lentilactobacillus parabuchneri TaxID=152331 RepID=UPI000A11B201|nr:helix-turn-helix transcriptional regulator [Lentilactobacillus parabuchneri]ORN05180.1 HTH-type transcriptional regulator ImmR [Lentilactobacillus parabuchneri]